MPLVDVPPFSSKRTLKDDVCAMSSAAKITGRTAPTINDVIFVLVHIITHRYCISGTNKFKEETIE